MSKVKSNFRSYLGEWDGTAGGVAGAFSPYVLSNTQLTQDPEKDKQDEQDDEDKQRERLERIHKELIDSLDDDTNQDDSIVVDPDKKMSSNDRLLTHLKNLLFREPGYSSFTDDEPESDNPSPTDHEIFNGGRQLMNMGEPVHNTEYSFMDDPNNPRQAADSSYSPLSNDKEEQHEQLMAAIRELRDELRKSRDGSSGAVNVEQEEETEEDQADDTTQFSNATKMFQTLVNQKMSRSKIIAAFEKQLGVTNSTAVSYYQRLAKQAGLTNSGDRELPGEPSGLGQARGFDDQSAMVGGEPPSGAALSQETNVNGVEVPNDPNKQGLIRYVKGAHLVYKRQNEEGTYDELWVFGTGGNMEDGLKVRRNILAGTDIPPRATKSVNGQQSYTLKTLGNGQILHIKGLPN